MEAGIFKEPLTAIIDSSPVHGAGTVADTYELIRKMIGRLARAMGEPSRATVLRAEALELAAAKPDIDWQDPAARRAHLGGAGGLRGRGCWARPRRATVAGDPEVAEAAGLLAQVVLQDVERPGEAAGRSARGWPRTG